MNDTDFFIGAAFLEAPDVQDESGLHAYYSRELVIACMQEAIDALVPAPINLPAAKALIRAIGPGYRVIYRDAFRWKDEQGHVLPNHYECFSTENIVEDNNYELLLDLGYAAILVDNRRDRNA